MLWHEKEAVKLGSLFRKYNPALKFHSTWVGGLEDMKRVVPSSWTFDVHEFLQNHCIFPFYSPFVRPDLRERHLHWAIHRDGEIKGGRLPPCASFFPGISLKADYKACPQCAREQIEKFGEPYLDRSHHIPGLRFCPEHRLPLATVGLKNDAAAGLQKNLLALAATTPTSSPLPKSDLLDHLRDSVIQLFGRPLDFNEKINVYLHVASSI
jgi:hypothetical protein